MKIDLESGQCYLVQSPHQWEQGKSELAVVDLRYPDFAVPK